jgi:hypothetical protein
MALGPPFQPGYVGCAAFDRSSPVQLMLWTMLACIAIGLTAPRFGRRQQLLVVLVAASMTVLYYVFPWRFV